MQENIAAIISNDNHDVRSNNNYDVQIIDDLGAEACKRRRTKRINLLRERKLGHHQWREWKLTSITRRKLHDNEQRQKNTEQHRMARALMRMENFMKCEDIKFKDADWHRKYRLRLSNEQLDHFRRQNADRHRTARAHLTDEAKKQVRQTNAFQHLMARCRKYYEVACLKRKVTCVLEYHRKECKKLGGCEPQCKYREIYKYVDNEDERQLIRESRPECHFRWKY